MENERWESCLLCRKILSGHDRARRAIKSVRNEEPLILTFPFDLLSMNDICLKRSFYRQFPAKLRTWKIINICSRVVSRKIRIATVDYTSQCALFLYDSLYRIVSYVWNSWGDGRVDQCQHVYWILYQEKLRCSAYSQAATWASSEKFAIDNFIEISDVAWSIWLKLFTERISTFGRRVVSINGH